MEDNVILTDGLFTDAHPIGQPKGTSPHILHGVYDPGKLGMLSNELGFSALGIIDTNEQILCMSPLDKGDCVIFTTTPLPYFTGNGDRILYYNGITTTVLIDRTDLGFSVENEITCIFRYNSQTQRRIYWNQKHQPVRFLDIDAIPSTLTVEELSLFTQNLKVPQIEITSIQENAGNIPSGMYFVSIAYQDAFDNQTNWLTSTVGIPITPYSKGGQTLQGHTYDGAPPKTPTSKAINLVLSNIDTNYAYIVLGITKCYGGVFSSYVSNKVTIVNTTLNIAYTGNELEELIDNAEILVPKLNYIGADHMTQKDNRLILGGLTVQEDLALQQYVSNIISCNTFKTISENDINTNFKDEKFNTQFKGYATDEVQAFAFVGIYKNSGALTKPFHIPGRPISTSVVSGGSIDSNEDTMISTGNIDNFVGDYIAGSGNGMPYWHIHNTGLGGSQLASSIGTKQADTAFWQSNIEYPISKGYPTTGHSTCGGGIPSPSAGNTFIRHHKVNDDTISFTADSNDVLHFTVAGFSFANIIIPKSIRSKLQGFKIVRGIRNSNNSSIIAKGTANPTFVTPYSINHSEVNGGNMVVRPTDLLNLRDTNTKSIHLTTFIRKDILSVYSPELQFLNKTITAGNYLRLKIPVDTGTNTYHNNGANGFTPTNNTNTSINGTLWSNEALAAWITNWSQHSKHNYKISGSVNLAPDTYQDTPSLNINLANVQNKVDTQLDYQSSTMVRIDRDIDYTIGATTHGQNVPFVYIKKYLPDQWGALQDITYVDTGFEVLNLQETDFDDLDRYIPAKDISTTTINVFGGDIFVGNFSYRLSNYIINNVHPDPYFGLDLPSALNTYIWNVQTYPESTINVNYRHELASTAGDKYCPRESPDYMTQTLGTNYDNSTSYNTDYSVSGFNQIASIADNAVDITSYVNRVAFSLETHAEDLFDNYRNFLANNYRDLPTGKGLLTNMFIEYNKLLVQTPLTCFDMQANQQSFESNTNDVYVGTGSYLSLTPEELYDAELKSTGGTINKFSCVETPHGYFFIDALNFTPTKISLVSMGMRYMVKPTQISKGLTKFFLDHTEFELVLVLRTIGINYTNTDNPANPNGLGWSCTYDPLYDRVIFSKKDYKPTSTFLDAFEGVYSTNRDNSIYNTYSNGDIVMFGMEFFYLTTPVGTPKNTYNWSIPPYHWTPIRIDLVSNANLFTNYSFSISYNLGEVSKATWVSLHKYIPSKSVTLSNDRVLVRRNEYLPTNQDDHNVYETNVGDYGKFFNGVIENFEVEAVANENIGVDKQFTNINVHAFSRSGVYPNDVDEPLNFFEKLWVYNHYQSSREIALLVSTVFADSNNVKLVKANEYRINQFYNIFNEGITNIFVNDGVFKVFKNVSTSVNWYEQTHFHGKYNIFRLISNNTSNKSLAILKIECNSVENPG